MLFKTYIFLKQIYFPLDISFNVFESININIYLNYGCNEKWY